MTGWKLVFFSVAVAALMLQDTASALPAQRQCPNGEQYFFCIVNPCDVTKCPRFPDARCKADYCGGCNARFYVGKTEVTDHCNTDYCQTEDGGRIECDGLCDVDPFTSLPYCSPSCDINNGGCADDEECVLETVFCIRAPCPPLVSCRPKENPCNLIDCAPGTTCRVNENTGAGECIKDICALEVEPGPCRGSIPSYFFNFKSGQCEKFIYGGCGGNENRFSLLEDCLETCGVTEPTENPCNLIDCAPGTTCRVNKETGAGECVEDICSLKPVTGPCEAYIPSYFFNSASGQCEKFIYGGCGGNDNRFSLLEDCREKCGEVVPTEDPCNLIDCAPGTTCRVNEETGAGECVEEPTTNPCSYILCHPSLVCQVNRDTGDAECVPNIIG